MSLPATDTPLGAMRFNSDSQKLEFWDGAIWMQINTFSPNLNGSARGITGGHGPASNRIEYITIETQGNAVDFGDLTKNTYLMDCSSSTTRGVWNGGYTNVPSGTYINTIQYVTISSTGNAADFGDLTQIAAYNGATSSATRGIRAGGTAPVNPSTDTIDYYTFTHTGNALDFGNLIAGTSHISTGNVQSPTRGMWQSGGPGTSNVLEYINQATTGNGKDFGDMTGVVRQAPCGVCNSVRGCWGGGPNSYHYIDYTTTASLGNSTRFGEMTYGSSRFAAASSPIRGVYFGGGHPGVNIIDYITIPTEGDAVDFGDLLDIQGNGGGLSNAHGGLG